MEFTQELFEAIRMGATVSIERSHLNSQSRFAYIARARIADTALAAFGEEPTAALQKLTDLLAPVVAT